MTLVLKAYRRVDGAAFDREPVCGMLQRRQRRLFV